MADEITKQLLDQVLHVAMTAASIWAIAAVVSTPSFHNPTRTRQALGVAFFVTVCWTFVREWIQLPSDRWWDMPLDLMFASLGIGLGAATWWRWMVDR